MRILTGGKGQKLVAVFGGYAGIVKRQFLALLNIGCEILGSLRIDELIIFEAFRTVRINHGFEHGKVFKEPCVNSSIARAISFASGSS